MTTPSNPTRTHYPDRGEGARPGLGRDGHTTSQPTPRERPRPSEDAEPSGGGWGRQSGELPVEGPEDGDGY